MTKNKIRESEVKNRLRMEYFSEFDWTRAVGDIDLTVCSRSDIGTPVTYLWAETKKGTREDIFESLIQLVLTIGKARTFESELPPYFLGAADAEKIAFVEFSHLMTVFQKTDFNWNVTPSDHGTKEFRELYDLLHGKLSEEVVIFKFAYDDKTLRQFIRKNFVEGRADVARIPVNKNNFTFVYYDWVKNVKDSILMDWAKLEKQGVLDCDFFLADLMSVDDMSIRDRLKVVLEKTKYKVLQKIDFDGMFNTFTEIPFRDNMVAYRQFWNRYQRPPKPVYQKYILERRDLLVPQNIREVKGSYYTPEVWVRLAQEYLAKTLGEDWQDEYFVWDCAAGSGNLLRGLTNKYNVYASTLDDADVKIMHTAIDEGRLNLVKSNVFQFDFLNDDFSRLPESLRRVVEDPERRKKLCVFINPPYKEASSNFSSAGTGTHSPGVSLNNKVYYTYKGKIGQAISQIYAQFAIRICKEIDGCVLSIFSTLKILQAPHFDKFRKLMGMAPKNPEAMFLVPANTFDNVSGDFPIAFTVFQTGLGENTIFCDTVASIYQNKGTIPEKIGEKKTQCLECSPLIGTWVKNNRVERNIIAYIKIQSNDFQAAKYVNIYSSMPADAWAHHGHKIDNSNLLKYTSYHAVRRIPLPTWLNDGDQFLAPKPSWAADVTFQADCLIWSIFNNAVRSSDGVCHWIPYYEDEVDAVGPFNSRFMADFLHGKIARKTPEASFGDLFDDVEAQEATTKAPLEAASPEALAVLDKGREIWRYYMRQPGAEANASYLDTRAFFQGYRTTSRGKRIMNSSSEDATYQRLLTEMRALIKALEAVIEPKIYEHGFLLK